MNKHFLLLATLICSSVATFTNDVTTTLDEHNQFVPKKYSIDLVITKGHGQSDADFKNIAHALHDVIESGKRGSSTFTQRLLTFIKELQEAIIAGLNVFGTASATETTLVNALGSVATEMIMSSAADEQETTAEHKGLKEQIVITYSIIADTVEKMNIWEFVKEKMNHFVQAVNGKDQTPDAVEEMLTDIILTSSEYDLQPMISVSTTLSNELLGDQNSDNAQTSDDNHTSDNNENNQPAPTTEQQ